MTARVLLAWLGDTDLRAARGDVTAGIGPIGAAVEKEEYAHIYLLSNRSKEVEESYRAWLSNRTKARITIYHRHLSGPTEWGEIYEAALSAVDSVQGELSGKSVDVTYHVSPGTPAMSAAWVLLAKTSRPARLIESSKDHGVREVFIPFDIAVDYVPTMTAAAFEEIESLTQGLPPEAAQFGDIVCRSKAMRKLVAQARRVAVFDVSVLIQGESGTGKELFARAIHAGSARRRGPFVAVNCGAIPSELVESELFGCEKGAYTGAIARVGCFERANSGTIFLDEIGELPLLAQTKLLRVLQEREIQRLGSTRSPKKVDIRVIAATNRNLLTEVAEGRFREDLFYRFAEAILMVPPLRNRAEDRDPLIDDILKKLNERFAAHAGRTGTLQWVAKRLAPGARNLLLRHPWPGNVREMMNTLARAAIWNPGETITEKDIREALLASGPAKGDEFLSRNLGEGFRLDELMASIARHYVQQAMTEAQGVKSRAAKLVGFKSYQRFSDWMRKYGIEFPKRDAP